MAVADRRPDYATFDAAAPTALPTDAEQKARQAGPDLFRIGQALRALADDHDDHLGVLDGITAVDSTDPDYDAKIAAVPVGGFIAVVLPEQQA